MSPALRRLLAFLGFVGAGFGVYTVVQGVTRAQLVTAGLLTSCVPVLATCPVSLPSGYDTVSFQAARCPNPDGGRAEFIIPPKIANNAQLIDKAFCTIAAGCLNGTVCGAGSAFLDTGATTVQAPHECACWQVDAGACKYVADGGTVVRGNTIASGNWVGPGCVPKVCVELFGKSSWPAACPP